MVTRLKQSQISHLAALQYGRPLPTDLIFRAELSSLCHSYPTNTAFQTFFRQQHPSVERNSYIVHIAPSPDRSLAAIASSNGCIEVHEPSVDDSHRLSLERISPDCRFAALAYPSSFPGDHILAVAAHVPLIYHFDIQNCRVDRPTNQFKFIRSGVPINDITALGKTCFAATRSDQVSVFDLRSGRTEVMSADMPHSGTPCLVTQGNALIVGTDRRLFVYDWRKFSKTNGSNRKVVSFQSGATNYVIGSIDLVNHLSQPLGALNSICALPDAPDGYLLFHTKKGTIGTIDIASGRINLLEEERRRVAGQNGLYEYGRAFSSMTDPNWYVARRRVDIIKGSGSRGWRVLVPNMFSSGVRIVGVADDMPLQQFNIPALKDVQATSVLAVKGKLDKLVVGTATNGVQAFEVDMGRSWREKKASQETTTPAT